MIVVFVVMLLFDCVVVVFSVNVLKWGVKMYIKRIKNFNQR